MKKSAVSSSSIAQRLETTAGTPAEKNARASDDAPSVADNFPSAVLQPERITSRVRAQLPLGDLRREHRAVAAPFGRRAPRWDSCGAFRPTTACPAKCRISIRRSHALQRLVRRVTADQRTSDRVERRDATRLAVRGGQIGQMKRLPVERRIADGQHLGRMRETLLRAREVRQQ